MSSDESSTLNHPDDHLLGLDSTSLGSQPQDTFSVEIEFVPDFEEHLDNTNLFQ